jgi:hypothetical protein
LFLLWLRFMCLKYQNAELRERDECNSFTRKNSIESVMQKPTLSEKEADMYAFVKL